jgi:nicotinate dehydrogenase subunit A
LALTVRFTINAREASVDVAEGDLLIDTLRNRLDVKGVRFGCGMGQCGACAVLVDGVVTLSCQTETTRIDGRTILSVEGLGTPGAPHPLQTAFIELQAGQCGYCLSGILVSAKALLDRNPHPARAEIAEALDLHLCRCGVHNRVLEAVALAARRMREGADA